MLGAFLLVLHCISVPILTIIFSPDRKSGRDIFFCLFFASAAGVARNNKISQSLALLRNDGQGSTNPSAAGHVRQRPDMLLRIN